MWEEMWEYCRQQLDFKAIFLFLTSDGLPSVPLCYLMLKGQDFSTFEGSVGHYVEGAVKSVRLHFGSEMG